MKREAGIKNNHFRSVTAAIIVITACALLISGALKETLGMRVFPVILSFDWENPVYEQSVEVGTAQNELGLPSSLWAVLPFSADESISDSVMQNNGTKIETTKDDGGTSTSILLLSVASSAYDNITYGTAEIEASNEPAPEEAVNDESASIDIQEEKEEAAEAETAEDEADEATEDAATEEDASEEESAEDESAIEESMPEKGFCQSEPLSYKQYGYKAPENEDELRRSGRLVLYTISYSDGSLAFRIYGTYDGKDEGFYACDEGGNIYGIVQEIPVTWYGSYDADTPGTYTFTARIDGYESECAMPTAVITVLPPEDAGADIDAELEDGIYDDYGAGGYVVYNAPPVRRLVRGLSTVTVTTNTGILPKLAAMNKDDSIVVSGESWIALRTTGSGDNKAVLLLRKAGDDYGPFGTNSNYEGSVLQQHFTHYYRTWDSTLKGLAIVPKLGNHTSESATSEPDSNLMLASSTTQEKDIVFALSRQDMVTWNDGRTTPVRSTIRGCFSQQSGTGHVWLRTLGKSSKETWELLNQDPSAPGYISNTLQVDSPYTTRAPAVWVKAADVWHKINVHYIDTDGVAITSPESFEILHDESFTIDKVAEFTGYSFTGIWRKGKPNSADKTGPITAANVKEDTDIYLIYEKVPSADITVAKEVTGVYGNQTKVFKFTVRFLGNNNSPLQAVTFNYTGGIFADTGVQPPEDGTLTTSENGEADFLLGHGQTITIYGVPADCKIVLTEESDINYDVRYADDTGTVSGDSNRTSPITISDKNMTIKFTNDRKYIVPTGIRY